uniref:Uncharacterized protein n=1 Tax=Leersia perrieri TaxID=77586 RepID=A0A0D9XQZ8_9ORYZ
MPGVATQKSSAPWHLTVWSNASALYSPLGDITDLSAAELRNKRARERYASLSAEKKEDKKIKNREYKQRKKDSSIGLYKSGTNMVGDVPSSGGGLRINCQMDTYESSALETTKEFPIVEPDRARPQSFVTPTRLLSNDGATCNDNKENTDIPFSCILQGGTQSKQITGFGSDKIVCGPRRPLITPARLPFMMNDDDAGNDSMQNTELPHSCIVEGRTQNSTAPDFINEKTDNMALYWLVGCSEARYAALTPEQKQARRDRQRAKRDSMTIQQKQQTSAHRKAARESLPDVVIHDINKRTKSRRQNVTSGERGALLSRRNARYAAMHDKPCAESIAMECPCSQTTADVSSTLVSEAASGADQPSQSYTMDNGTTSSHYNFSNIT